MFEGDVKFHLETDDSDDGIDTMPAQFVDHTNALGVLFSNNFFRSLKFFLLEILTVIRRPLT